MTARVVVTSKSKLLSISMDNDRCSMKCSHDGSVLYVDPPDKSFVSSIDLTLRDNAYFTALAAPRSTRRNHTINTFESLCNDDKEISAVSFSAGCTSTQQRIRTDGLFSIVFDADESIALIPNSDKCRLIVIILSLWVFDLLSSTDFVEERTKFEMKVNVHLVDEIPDLFESRSAPVPIYSGVLKVDDYTIHLLATTGPFFNALFYSGFSEQQKGIFEIKEIDKDDFLWFLDSIHQRAWTFSSVDRAMTALSFADRFNMLYLHKNVLPYLKKNSLPKEDIKDVFLLCEGFRDNDDIIAWVLSQCKLVPAMIDLVSECAPFIQMSSILSAHKALKGFVDSAISDATLAVVKNCGENTEIPVLLRCKDTQSSAVKSSELFTIPSGIATTIVAWATDIWPKIPVVYDTAACEGRVFNRGGDESVRYTTNKVLVIDAYHP